MQIMGNWLLERTLHKAEETLPLASGRWLRSIIRIHTGNEPEGQQGGMIVCGDGENA